MPHKGKRPTSNQHDRRHESGLAAPGKRISRQRSIGNINGVVLGNVRVGASPAQPAVAPTNNGTTAFSSATDEGLRYARTKATVTAPAGAPVNPAGSGRTISNASSDTQATPPRRLRQPDTRAATLPDCQEPSSAVRILLRGRGLGAVVNTILTTCPLRDVLALLIILLQLPPMLLMLIQLLYAILTSLPPVPSSTVSAISEFLSGSVGVSSMTAVIGIDLVIFGIWLLLQLPARNVLLDCSQAVIAMTLGGATASVADATYGWSLCTFVILFSYVFRSASFRRHSLQLLSRQFSSIAMVHSDSLLLDEPIDKLYSSHSWPGVLLGIHILAQGLTRAVRRNLHFRAADKIKSRAATADYELSSTSETPRSQSVGSDLELDRFSQDSDDTDYYLSRTANDINVKARRTKDNEQHVRKHQPLWAALANTKISVLKAVDRGGVTFDAIRANTAGPNSVGSMDFLTDEEQVWFTEISTMGAAFEACLRYEDGGGQRNIDEEALGDPRGRAKRTPFFIRVNGTEWMSSRAQLVEVKGDEKRCGIWAGEILGLAAQSSYDCEFLRSADGRVIYQLKITTPTVSSSDQAPVKPVVTYEPTRPTSPVSTLNTSVTATENQLIEHKGRLKRNRKDHKNALQSLRKELDGLNNRLASSAGSEDRLKHRELQLQQHILQAENAASAIAREVEATGELPTAERAEYEQTKAGWEAAERARKGAQRRLDSSRQSADEQLAMAKANLASTTQKRDRLQARLAKLAEQHDRLSKWATEASEKRLRQEDQHAVQAAQRVSTESQYMAFIEAYERQAVQLAVKMQTVLRQIQYHEASLASHGQPRSQTPAPALDGSLRSSASVPTTPGEALLALHLSASASTRPSPLLSSFPGLSFAAAGPSASYTSAPMDAPPLVTHSSTRARSSSLLSNVSGFTDQLDLDTTASAAATPFLHHFAQPPPPPTSALESAAPGAGRANRRRTYSDATGRSRGPAPGGSHGAWTPLVGRASRRVGDDFDWAKVPAALQASIMNGAPSLQ